MTFIGRYNDRPDTLKCDREVESDSRKGRVHSLNDLDITVWEDGEVTARRKYYASGDPKKHFPHMEVSEGRIIIAIEDLVGEILARITPLELAEGIISDDEARDRLIHCLAQRYANPGFEDVDRRKWLTAVQAQVHDKALDRMVELMNARETELRSKHDYYRWKVIEIGHYRILYEKAIELCGDNEDARLSLERHYIHPDKLKEYCEKDRDPVVTESVGPQWTDSRNFWRSELLKLFPPPTDT
jgi:hypothetical protein